MPLLAENEVIGVLVAGVAAPRRFSRDDLALLGLAADRVGLAIHHARVFEREHHIAVTLQRSLSPIACRSCPASRWRLGTCPRPRGGGRWRLV